jgi:hypothetical protein
MGNILRTPNGNAVLMTPRSGSHSLARAALIHYWPELWQDGGDNHPASLLPVDEGWDGSSVNVGIVVRNPVERFRSMCAHRLDRTLEEHLDSPMYGPLPQGTFARYFRFEDQLDAAAEWLGLPTPLPHEDATDEADKSTLTPEQEARVREIYADDIALWESLQ